MKCAADIKLATQAYLATLTPPKMTPCPSHSSHEGPPFRQSRLVVSVPPPKKRLLNKTLTEYAILQQPRHDAESRGNIYAHKAVPYRVMRFSRLVHGCETQEQPSAQTNQLHSEAEDVIKN